MRTPFLLLIKPQGNFYLILYFSDMGKKRGPPLITPRLGLSQEAVNKLLRPHKRRFGHAKTLQPQQHMSDFSHRFLRRYRGKKPVVWETYVDPNEEGMPVHQNYRYMLIF